LRPVVSVAMEHQFIADTTNLGGGDRPVQRPQGAANMLERAHDRVVVSAGRSMQPVRV